MPRIPLLLSTLLLLAATVLGTSANAAPKEPPVTSVPHLDLSRYAGNWYEIAHLPVSFQKKCVGETTAHYTLRDDGLVGVRNRCRIADGGFAEAEGVARTVPGHPGRLEVRFAPDWLAWVPWVWADYWVIALDPDYEWAVVGEPGRRYLWILSRSPTMPRMQFETLKARAAAVGYDLEPLILTSPLD